MITVEVRLFAFLRRYRPELKPGGFLREDLPPGATLADLVERLGIPMEETKLLFVNGEQQKPGYVLQNGDRVGLFPPIAGGSPAGVLALTGEGAVL